MDKLLGQVYDWGRWKTPDVYIKEGRDYQLTELFTNDRRLELIHITDIPKDIIKDDLMLVEGIFLGLPFDESLIDEMFGLYCLNLYKDKLKDFWELFEDRIYTLYFVGGILNVKHTGN